MAQTFIQDVRFDDRGLIPAVVQDCKSGEILALQYLDNASLARTLQTGQTTFIDTNAPDKPRVGTSRLVDVRLNADGGSLTVLIERDPDDAGHSGSISLLPNLGAAESPNVPEVSLVNIGSMELGLAIDKLYALIEDRREKRPEGSYTSYLFNSGLDKILKKIAEESGEVIIAAKNARSRELVSELADLFYHLLVLMVERDVKLDDVHGELTRRAGQAPHQDQA